MPSQINSSINRKIPHELIDLSNRVGGFIHYWGFKEVHGKIWLMLYVSEVPLDAAEIMNRLNISKALVSLSVSDLLKYEVIQEAGKSENSTQLYRANPDLMDVILKVLRSREKRMLSETQYAIEQVKKLSVQEKADWKIKDQRLTELSDFVDQGQQALQTLLSLSEQGLGSLKI